MSNGLAMLAMTGGAVGPPKVIAAASPAMKMIPAAIADKPAQRMRCGAVIFILPSFIVFCIVIFMRMSPLS